ncbi:MAG: hypothetical protein K0S28_2040 [Paucimonas sp.]|jgi:hypothetical protein|nr:hypothetical protein [Paucimonas sp.]
MTNNFLIKQRQQFVRFMRAKGVGFDEIVRMLREIGNPPTLSSALPRTEKVRQTVMDGSVT